MSWSFIYVFFIVRSQVIYWQSVKKNTTFNQPPSSMDWCLVIKRHRSSRQSEIEALVVCVFGECVCRWSVGLSLDVLQYYETIKCRQWIHKSRSFVRALFNETYHFCLTIAMENRKGSLLCMWSCMSTVKMQETQSTISQSHNGFVLTCCSVTVQDWCYRCKGDKFNHFRDGYHVSRKYGSILPLQKCVWAWTESPNILLGLTEMKVLEIQTGRSCHIH